RFELFRHLVEVDRLVVHPLLGVAAREDDEVVGLDRNRAFGRDRPESRSGRDGLFGHLTDYYPRGRRKQKAEGRRRKAKCRDSSSFPSRRSPLPSAFCLLTLLPPFRVTNSLSPAI